MGWINYYFLCQCQHRICFSFPIPFFSLLNYIVEWMDYLYRKTKPQSIDALIIIFFYFNLFIGNRKQKQKTTTKRQSPTYRFTLWYLYSWLANIQTPRYQYSPYLCVRYTGSCLRVSELPIFLGMIMLLFLSRFHIYILFYFQWILISTCIQCDRAPNVCVTKAIHLTLGKHNKANRLAKRNSL